MAIHRTKKGLDLPILGAPAPGIVDHRPPSRVAVLGADFPGLRPTMHVSEGDEVRRGELLFEDKKLPGVRFTAPGSGRVVAVHRGERRAFESVVIELSADDRANRVGSADQVSFGSVSSRPSSMSRDEVRDLLLESGEWTALRTRPFGRVASPSSEPHSIFVTAVDTNPLSVPVEEALAGRHGDFERGLRGLAKLTRGPVYVCTAEETTVPVPDGDPFRHERFAGPHPSGTAGYHIHVLDPVGLEKTVWYVGFQDVVAIGRLLESGELDLVRVVSLAGPSVQRPRLVRTRRGASTTEMVEGELVPGDHRVVSGSVLSGRKAMGDAAGYLGRFHTQVSVLPEDRERRFLGWLGPGIDKFSAQPAFVSRLFPKQRISFTTSTYGSRRAIVPIGSYEKVMPMDLLPTHLLRALVMRDVERAQLLGCLELEEEDLALCTFVDVGKADFGKYLREVLTTIEKES